MKKWFWFLGSVYFAILLIFLSVCYVIAGTLIESGTSSHLYAAHVTYNNPVFNLLLCGFFCNIFISTLRRWPFHLRHIPFIITHIGLLMILGGVLVKNYFGKQGSLSVMEGSGQDVIYVQNSSALLIESKNQQWIIPFNQIQHHSIPEDVSIEMQAYYPHSKENLETWIKGNKGSVFGLPLFPLNTPIKAKLSSDQTAPWNILALRSDDPPTIAQEMQKLFKKDPTILFVENPQNEVYLFSFQGDNVTYSEVFKNDTLSKLVVYDRGFGSYNIFADIPYFEALSSSDLEKLKLDQIRNDLMRALDNRSELAFPLKIMRRACSTDQDFVECFLEFLSVWNATGSLVFNDAALLSSDFALCLDGVSKDIKKGCWWTAFVLTELQNQLLYEPNLLTCLQQMQWPLLSLLEKEATEIDPQNSDLELIHRLVQQIFSVAAQLPDPTFPLSDRQLLSSLFLLHKIHLNYIQVQEPETAKTFKLECPISFKYHPESPLTKLEDNCPLLKLKFTDTRDSDEVYLRFDRSLNALKTPILKGKYLVRFQPYYEEIPYRVRLRQARQIHYPGSTQPCSYECDILIKDKRTKDEKEATLSMNHVYETWEGYRFYLSNIYPNDESSVKRVQIVVNLDPAKYILTYPGCILLVIGTISLFWMISRR